MENPVVLDRHGGSRDNTLSPHHIALYLRSLVNYEKGQIISQLMVYKLTYYAQAWSLVFLREPLFRGEIQAWQHGPVPIDIRSEYKDYAGSPIPKPSESKGGLMNLFTDEQLKVLNLVWDKYGDFSASKLWELCHLEDPWVDARGDLPPDASSNILITEDSIRDYYAQFAYIDDGQFVIEDEILKVNKNEMLFGAIELKDGSIHKVSLSETNAFFKQHKENLVKKHLVSA